jgi:hypothetical protein
VKANLQRRKTNQEDANMAFAGMDARAAIEARSARDSGRPNQAKIMRRLTSPSKTSETSWF